MIGTSEMSSTTMDLGEAFRPEDIEKTDFFDFVAAPNTSFTLGINLQQNTLHQHSHHLQHHSSLTEHTSHQQQQSTTEQQAHSSPLDTLRNSPSVSLDDASGVGSNSIETLKRVMKEVHSVSGRTSGINNCNATSLSELTALQFWSADKDNTHRLESAIFEDLDHYCWQQQEQTSSTNTTSHIKNLKGVEGGVLQDQHKNSTDHNTSVNTTINAITSPHAQLPILVANNETNCNNTSPITNSTTALAATKPQANNVDKSGTPSVFNADGQFYTLTVLNGNDSWLKRESNTQLQNSLELDCLLSSFPNYIKSEYAYDESCFSIDTTTTKDTNTCDSMPTNSLSTLNNDIALSETNRNFPPLLSTITTALTNTNTAETNTSQHLPSIVCQQINQFQNNNNNNDWHTSDHNTEQSSAESLLRSALQGKGYAKGFQLNNGINVSPPSSTIVKEDEIRRLLFPVNGDSLGFSNSNLSASQLFDDTQSANTHSGQFVMTQHTPQTNGPFRAANNHNNSHVNSSNVSSLMTDDIFLLDNAFSDDFEKIKRIAIEVQQFCSTSNTSNDYPDNEVIMQGSCNEKVSSGTLAQLATAPSTTVVSTDKVESLNTSQISAQSILEVEITKTNLRTINSGKVSKKYKRSTSNEYHNNTNNTNIINNKKSRNTKIFPSHTLIHTTSTTSSGSSTNSSNSPTHCNTNSSNSNKNKNSTTTTISAAQLSVATYTNQRKERSLHYCSICSKGFKDKYSVNVHIRTHTGEKPFACTLCGKKFRQKAHLAKHYQTHLAQKNNSGLHKNFSSNKHQRPANVTSKNLTVNSSTPSTSIVLTNTNNSIPHSQQHMLQLGLCNNSDGNKSPPTNIAIVGGNIHNSNISFGIASSINTTPVTSTSNLANR